MKIFISHDLIQEGIPAECYRCPLALAFGKAGFEVCVGQTWVQFLPGGQSYQLPEPVAAWVIYHDHGYPMREISFDFDAARGLYDVRLWPGGLLNFDLKKVRIDIKLETLP